MQAVCKGEWNIFDRKTAYAGIRNILTITLISATIAPQLLVPSSSRLLHFLPHLCTRHLHHIPPLTMTTSPDTTPATTQAETPTLTFFITGTSSGLGLSLTTLALAQGHRVVATIRKADALAELHTQYPDALLPLVLDVTSKADVDKVVAEAIAWAGQVHVVINNAGYGLMGNVEGMTEEQIRHVFDTNFFGALWVTQAFLPHFRAHGGGRFLHMSSIAGLNANAGGAMYSASKFALEGLSEGLMKEGQHLNIFSTLIEPGPFRTFFAGSSLVFAADTIADYEPSVGAMQRYLQGANGNQKGDPDLAAAAMLSVAIHPAPPIRLLLGAAAYRVAEQKFNDMLHELQQWRWLGLPTDFPEAQQ